jgi:hypothetical protein
VSAEEDKILLIRLDERVRVLNQKQDDILEKIDEMRNEFRSEYVTQKEFEPVRRAVYAAIGLVATAIIGAAIAVVFGFTK